MASKLTINIADVADDLGLSVGTVSKALNAKAGQVSMETAKKVLQYCVKNNFLEPDKSEIILNRFLHAKNLSNNILVLTSRQAIPMYATVYQGISEHLQSVGVTPSLHIAADTKSLETIDFEKFNSAILTGAMSNEIVQKLVDSQVRVVVVDNRVDCVFASSVNSSNLESIKKSVKYLSHLGHNKIAFLCIHEDIPSYTYTFHQRELGYISGFSELGIKIDPELLIVKQSRRFSQEEVASGEAYIHAKTFAAQVMTVNPYPTAVITMNDNLGYILREVITENGLKVPDDISIIGYDGQHRLGDNMLALAKPISTNIVNWYEMGRQAAELALNMACDPKMSDRHIEVPTVFEDCGTVASVQNR